MNATRATERMSRPNDARALKSRQALRKGLLELIGKQTFHDISIKDITRQAGVSYPVFFRRYASKEELLEDVAADQVRELLAFTSPSRDQDEVPPESSLHDMCVYVSERRGLWKTLLTAGASSIMRDEFARISAEYAHEGPRKNPWLPVALASSFVASGIFEILAWWLEQPEDYPIRNIEIFLERLIVRPTFVPQDVTLES